MNINKKYWLKIFIPTVIGGMLGYAYYYFIGCKNGCPIQSNPFASTLYGALIGGLLSFSSKRNQNSKSQPQ